MSMSDPIADMLTRVRNAGKARHPEVSMPSSKLRVGVATVLKETGYIRSWQVEGEGVHKTLTLGLKYQGAKPPVPVIEGLKRISKPSCRVYAGSKEIPRVLGGLGVAILSTSKGIMTDRSARAENLGGEVLCEVW